MSTESLRERLARHASSPLRADDAIKYAAAILHERTSWACEAIGTSEECGNTEQWGDDVHGDQLEAISLVVAEITALAAQFGDQRHYSDGRLLTSRADIEVGMYTTHIWHPDPSREMPLRWRGELLHDPGTPRKGIYEVSTNPVTQELYVRVLRFAYQPRTDGLEVKTWPCGGQQFLTDSDDDDSGPVGNDGVTQ